MLYRPYGKTGKQISVISAGGMRFKGHTTPADIENSAQVLVHAYRKGINYFDTAPYYCGDRSEEIVGAALKHIPRGRVFVSTKCGASTTDGIRRSLEKSLQRIGVDRINFFHIWCLIRPEEWDERKNAGAIDAAFRAKEEGLVDHVVVSTHMNGDDTARLIERNIFEGVTLGYNAINFPFRQKGVDAAGQAGIGLVIMNPLAGGLIPQNGRRFDFIRSPHDPDIVTAALRFLISQPAITSALVGFSCEEEVDHAVEALTGFEPYAAAFIERMKKKIESEFDQLCTGCGYCLPCPRNIPIPKYMDSFNHLILDGRGQAILDRLKWHWDLSPADAAFCEACGQCEAACTQHLPIIERLKQISVLQGAASAEEP
jgi:predicted aldo/keto reductase-like oxidoreductase